MKIKLRTIWINLILILIGIISNAAPLFVVLLLIWTNALLYSIAKIGRRSVLFVYLLVFFTFLIGREFVEQVFKYKIESFPDAVNIHAWICLIISVLTIWAFYAVFEKYNNKKDLINKKKHYIDENPFVRQISIYIYVFTWLFAILSRIIVGRYVSSNSYWDYYTGYSEYLAGNTILYLVSKIELIMPVALSLYTASMPSQKKFIIPGSMYVLYLVLSLLSGQRATFMLGLLFFVFYFLFRQEINPEEKWFEKKYIIMGIIVFPILMYLMTALSYWRGSTESVNLNLFTGLESFIYDQGVSLNAIKNAFIHSDSIPKQIYSLEFLHGGLLARLFGIPIYHGNTVEHAMHGGSFTHSLGYTMLGSMYLAGRGTGSSYIAEVYYDLGYLGVFLGNIIYAYVLANISRIGARNNTYIVAIRFYIINQLLWAPRGSFSGFIATLFTPTTLITFLFVYFIDKMMSKNRVVVRS